MEFKGNPVSPGIATGEVYLYKPTAPEIIDRIIGPDEVEAAVRLYFSVRDKAREELTVLKEKLFQTDNPEKAAIFDAHISILLDIAMNEEIEELIRDDLMSPECAVDKVYNKFSRLLSKAKDEQVRERVTDLKDIKTRLFRLFFDIPEFNLASLDKEVVIVAYDLFPSDTANMDRSKVLAIITETGGSTSHSAIIARSYEIPAILGLPNVMDYLVDGQTVIVDAVEGVLITSPDDKTHELYAVKKEAYLKSVHEIKSYLDVDPITRDGVRIEINLNIGSASQEELSGSLYTDGVGLFRTEFMYMTGSSLPTEEEQFRAYRKVAIEFGERPVILRTLDIGGDKKLDCMELPKEDNPFLGLRALRLCFANTPLFKTQLRAVLRAACYGNLWLMLPMVGSLDDIRAVKVLIEEVKQDLRNENIKHKPNIPVGIMIEIPAIAVIAEMAVMEVDFASIGTNDLCQYLTATDRLNPEVSKYYQSCHPAMFRLIEFVVSAFNAAGKPISICGEMGGDPLAAAALIGLGIRKLSMGISSVPQVKKLITGLSIPLAKSLADQLKACKTASEVENILKEGLSDIL